MYELSFSVVVLSESDSEAPFKTQDRAIARNYLPDDLCKLIMPIVCASIRSLVENVNPSWIYRVTKGRDLPAKAMEKHILVTGALQSCGYVISDEGTDRHQRTFWLLEKAGS